MANEMRNSLYCGKQINFSYTSSTFAAGYVQVISFVRWPRSVGGLEKVVIQKEQTYSFWYSFEKSRNARFVCCIREMFAYFCRFIRKKQRRSQPNIYRKVVYVAPCVTTALVLVSQRENVGGFVLYPYIYTVKIAARVNGKRLQIMLSR